mmetsp:Transcript_29191/g.35478  ORF Transcript_29191/g.35478 Transcript_29191/m.35478 type:complete len:211 (-) Transcript_29191:75-707(-)
MKIDAKTLELARARAVDVQQMPVPLLTTPAASSSHWQRLSSPQQQHEYNDRAPQTRNNDTHTDTETFHTDIDTPSLEPSPVELELNPVRVSVSPLLRSPRRSTSDEQHQQRLADADADAVGDADAVMIDSTETSSSCSRASVVSGGLSLVSRRRNSHSSSMDLEKIEAKLERLRQFEQTLLTGRYVRIDSRPSTDGGSSPDNKQRPKGGH